jgi:hypothetical protein
MKTIQLKEFLGLVRSTESAIGIQETGDLIKFTAALSVAGAKAWEDESIDLFDAKHLFSVIGLINPAFKGIKQIKYELADLQADELETLVQIASSELQGLSGNEAKELVLNWLNTGLSVYSSICRTIAYRNRGKVE